MTAASPAVKAVGDMVMDSDIDLDPTPLEVSPSGSAETCSTPDTELSVPHSPGPKKETLKEERIWAREKLAQLEQEEKVSSHCYPEELISLMTFRSPYLPLPIFGGRKRSLRKAFMRLKRVMGQMELEEGFSSVVRR